KTDDHGTTPTPSKPDQGKTDNHGTTPTPSKPDQGKTDDHKGDDSHTTTPSNPTTPSKPSDNSHVTTPKGDTKTDTTTNTTLPSDAHVVDGQVVNAQGQVIPGFKVENGTIVATNNSATTASVNTTAPVASATTMTREQYRASQNNKSNTDAKTLPQTGNQSVLGSIALGVAGLMAGLGLLKVEKRK
ncbi:LPXTG cell wall anchor domain-containing protein, partial [Limosilactobacillus reuteri]|uniref:LPXTG cell wall anchor domain-containing protein n=1 Tax=Limosilactobacillus reuteri TaxID=1598 RepID=UPI003D046F5C